MRPAAARVIITITILAVVIIGVGIVNSRYDGGFVAGLFIIVLPFVGLAYLLPLIIPVKCPTCSGRMRFQFAPQAITRVDETEPKEFYGYTCEKCSATHLWEGSTSGSSFD